VFKAILVAVDESPQAAAALELAIGLAKTLGAALTLVHAIDPAAIASAADDAAAATAMEIELEELQTAGLELVEAASAKARAAGISAATVVRDGTPSRVILDTARRTDSDLIVIGTHGRHGVARFFVGSCAEAVLRESPVPVLIKRS
jgi:nucleotide-binding universal stress UspA family protein